MVKRLGILGGVAIIGILLVMFAGSVLAAPPTPTPGQGNGFRLLDRVTLQRVATLLGTSPDDVSTQVQQGKTLLQVAQAKNVTEQALTDLILQPFKDRLTIEVKYGYLTQQQADATLQARRSRTKDLINATPGANGNSNGDGGCHGSDSGGAGGMMGSEGTGGMMGSGLYSGMMGSGGTGATNFGGQGMMGFW